MEEIHGNAGGPVFPQNVDFGDGQGVTAFGMSVRQYFAAHAPDVPPMFEYRRAQQPVDKGNGWKQLEMVAESDLARIIRWRMLYADQMLAALGAEHTPHSPVAGRSDLGMSTLNTIITSMMEVPSTSIALSMPIGGVQLVNIEIHITKVTDL